MTPDPIPVAQLEQLRTVSAQLLRLHKLLLDLQRAEYEEAHGPIGSTGEFLNLVLEHPSFEWLRQLSGIIVEIDEIRAPRSKAGTEQATSALDQVGRLLLPDVDGSPFQQRYWRALQVSPEVLIAHREIKRIVGIES